MIFCIFIRLVTRKNRVWNRKAESRDSRSRVEAKKKRKTPTNINRNKFFTRSYTNSDLLIHIPQSASCPARFRHRNSSSPMTTKPFLNDRYISVVTFPNMLLKVVLATKSILPRLMAVGVGTIVFLDLSLVDSSIVTIKLVLSIAVVLTIGCAAINFFSRAPFAFVGSAVYKRTS